MKTIKTFIIDYCENTDCKNSHKKMMLNKVVLTEDFGYDICLWCKDCIKQDNKMIKRACLKI